MASGYLKLPEGTVFRFLQRRRNSWIHRRSIPMIHSLVVATIHTGFLSHTRPSNVEYAYETYLNMGSESTTHIYVFTYTSIWLCTFIHVCVCVSIVVCKKYRYDNIFKHAYLHIIVWVSFMQASNRKAVCQWSKMNGQLVVSNGWGVLKPPIGIATWLNGRRKKGWCSWDFERANCPQWPDNLHQLDLFDFLTSTKET